MSLRKNAPTQVVWIVCFGLYLIALLGHFHVVRIQGNIVSWAWIIGFALLLFATILKRL